MNRQSLDSKFPSRGDMSSHLQEDLESVHSIAYKYARVCKYVDGALLKKTLEFVIPLAEQVGRYNNERRLIWDGVLSQVCYRKVISVVARITGPGQQAHSAEDTSWYHRCGSEKCMQVEEANIYMRVLTIASPV